MTNIRGKVDPVLTSIADALAAYEKEHPTAEISIYRQNSVSARIRIIDQDLAGLSKADRHDKLCKYLGALPEEIQNDISVLLLLTPEEKENGLSLANFDFDHPIPSSF